MDITTLVQAIHANLTHEDLATLSTDEDRTAAVAYANAATLFGVDLDTMEREVAATAKRLLDLTATTEDERLANLETARSMANTIEAIRAERERRAEVEAAQAAERAAVLEAIDGPQTTSLADGEGENEATEGAGDGENTETATGDGETTVGTTGGESDTTTETAATGTTETAVVPAPARPAIPRPSLDAIHRAQPAEARPTAAVAVAERVPVPLIAQADVPNHSFGTEIPSVEALTAAFIRRSELLGGNPSGNVANEKVAIGRFDYSKRLRMVPNDEEAAISLVASALGTWRNGVDHWFDGEGEALVASGGICAPTETVYGFVKINKPVGLAQDFLPTLGAPRGRIQFPTSPDIRTAFAANPSRAWTNAQDIAANATQSNTLKVVTTIACPTFVGCTIEAQYEILKFGNISGRSYPEWVQQWIGLSADVHAHLVSTKLIAQMIALSNTAVLVGPSAGATATILSYIALAAADYRSDLRMDDDAMLEVVLPIWIDDLIRSDLARARKGGLETLDISDAQIAGWFATLGIVPRYVTDWQTVSPNAATGATTWPATVSFMIYAPGTFVKLDMGTLDLGVVRDSTLNVSNDYHIFSESFESVCKPGIESRVYTATVHVTGAFSADQNIGDLGTDVAGS